LSWWMDKSTPTVVGNEEEEAAAVAAMVLVALESADGDASVGAERKTISQGERKEHDSPCLERRAHGCPTAQVMEWLRTEVTAGTMDVKTNLPCSRVADCKQGKE
jgi:hypothetical protein